MTDSTPEDRAVQLLAERRAKAAGSRAPDVAAFLADARQDVAALAAEGLLADPAALLNRLADLTEASGKARSTEWLRACATLPPDQWPPAPAYKGPMVPASEAEELRAEVAQLRADLEFSEETVRIGLSRRDLVVWLHAEAVCQRDEALADAEKFRDYLRVANAHVERRGAERDALQARLNAGLAVHSRDIAGDCEACIDADENPVPWPCATARALQADQPTEPEERP